MEEENGPSRTTFAFDKAAERKLRELAAIKGVSKTEIVRRALTLYDYLEAQRSQSSHIRIETASGEKVDLVLP
jgi:hypothetical protein